MTTAPTMEVVTSLPEELWRRFVLEHPDANIFHTPEMHEVFARAKGHRPEVWASMHPDGRIAALLTPVTVTLGGAIGRYLTSRAIAYGSVLRRRGPEGEEATRALLRAYDEAIDGAVLFTELRNLADLADVQSVLGDLGFAYEPHLDFLLPLGGGPDEVFSRIGRRTRKQIRHGLRVGEVVVTEATTREELSECYEVLRRTYGRARVPVADRSLFEAAFDVLWPRGMVKFVLARIGETCVAASVELVFKDTIYGWYGGVDREFVSRTPNELLMWHVLKWGAENGFRTYDFGGAGRPDEEYGVRSFKAKFGGELVCYGRNVRTHAPRRLAVGRMGYEVYRRLMSLRAANGNGTRRGDPAGKATEEPVPAEPTPASP
jgi:CelD/BcsL family acetyltransferase involved in cellulose biosynthesis